MLGSELDDKVPTDLYQKQRDGEESWHWDDTATSTSFETEKTRAGASDHVALVVSISGTIDVDLLPTEISGGA